MKKIYTRYHKLYLTDDIVKYKMNTNDLNYLKLYSINSKLNETVPGDIFFAAFMILLALFSKKSKVNI